MLSKVRAAWLGVSEPRARLDTIRPATWCLDRATIDNGVLTLIGWMLRAEPRPVTMTVNGRVCDETRFGANARPDVRALYSFVRSTEDPGFECRCSLAPDEISGARTLRIDLADASTMRPLREEQAFFVPVDACEKWPLPDDSRMKRVHGSADAGSFRIIGFSNLHKIDWALRRAADGGLESRRSILDWGCGSGRLLRYCDELGAAVTGVDIDEANLAWCRAHLPFASYDTVPLHPPSGLARSNFDLIIGVSIFTHLTEAVQFEWLDELGRILVPGGIAAVTIHGPAVAAASGSRHIWNLVAERGFIDTASHDFDEILDDKHYYRTTFHTHEYIRQTWSRYFEVIDVIPGCIGNWQDLVLLRGR
jgi:2-polyprenyl-3-methyl-5-hydroxy-6-metoxy-1,4-benzoquinol methylase